MRKLTLACACLLLCCFVAPLTAARVAVVGGGAAGLTTAWLLEPIHSVTLYEKTGRLGGHADSVDLMVKGKNVTVESGFEFFSKSLHPHFIRLLNHLQVPVNPFVLISTFYHTDGHDTIILPPFHSGRIEWESTDVSDLNRMIQFKKVLDAATPLIRSGEAAITLKTFIDSIDVTEAFKEQFLYPYIASGWGIETHKIKGYSAYNTLKYIVNGQEDNTYQWLEVTGGTKKYIDALSKALVHTKIKIRTAIENISYANGIYTITEDDGSSEQYDHLVLATHADEAGHLLKGIPEAQDMSTMLKKVRYIDTLIALHGDIRFMPPDKKDWRVANVRYDGKNTALTAYKKRPGLPPVFKSWVTLDVRAPGDNKGPMPDPLYSLAVYQHAVTDLDYYHVQRAAQMVQGNRNLWYAGAWMHDNDSHESAVISAKVIGEKLAPFTERMLVLQGWE